jgi:hypothetical protein
MISQANGTQKQAQITILISDKSNFKLKLVRRDKEVHFILMKGTIHQKNMTIADMYTSSIGTPSFKKQTLLDIKAYRHKYNNHI